MQYFAYSIAVWLILTACGLPLAFALLPPKLRRGAVPAAPIFGYCYIVFVAYHLYRANIGGTDLYAPFLLVPPLAGLLLLAMFRRSSLMAVFTRRTAVIAALAGLSFLAMSSFFLIADGRAVAMSLGNIDIVNYATAARYMEEFARDAHVGYLGQAVAILRNELDYLWFGPEAIAAVMSSLFKSEPFRLQSIVIAVIACQGAVFVHGIARDTLSLDRRAALSLGVLYAINPVIAYVVWEGFGAQAIFASIMLAVVYLVTQAGIERPKLRPQARFVPALTLLLSGLFVTYNFMMAVMGGLLGAYIMVFALAERSFKRLVAGGLLLAVAALLTVALDPLELTGFTAVTSSIADSNNGYFIPWLRPDSVLGMNTSLIFTGAGFSIGSIWGAVLSVLLALALAVHLLGRGRRPSHLAFVLGLALPVFLAGLYFAVAGAQDGTLGSYRSFKITSTFLAFTLLAFGIPFGARRPFHRVLATSVGGVLLAALAAFAVIDLRDLVYVGRESAFVPPDELRGIRKIEAIDSVSGINVLDNTNFTLLWIHYFTLRKRQIYQSWTPSGPLTEPYTVMPDPSGQPLAGGGILRLGTVGCAEPYRLTSKLLLCKRGTHDVMAMLGEGWWYPDVGRRWSGNGGPNADLLLDNVVEGARVRIKALYGTLRAGDAISLSVNGDPVPVEEMSTSLVSMPFALKAGRNVVRFSETFPPTRLSPLDTRTLGVAWQEISIEFADQRAGEADSK